MRDLWDRAVLGTSCIGFVALIALATFFLLTGAPA